MLRIAFVALVLAACGKSSESAKQSEAPPAVAPAKAAKDPETARKKIAAGAVVIDVRTQEEWDGGHLPQAVHIPITELPQRLPEVEKLTKGDKATSIVVYCASGYRSGKAKQQLDAAGYRDVVNGGGLDDLQ